MKTILLQHKNKYYLLSDETIKKGDYYLDSLVHFDLTNNLLRHSGVVYNDLVIQSTTGTTSPISTSRKVIATNFHVELPMIDCPMIKINGIFKLASDYVINEEYCEPNTKEGYIFDGVESSIIDAFEEGYRQCFETNEDKLFTIDQAREIFYSGANFEKDNSKNMDSFNSESSFKEMIRSLTTKEFPCEIEMKDIMVNKMGREVDLFDLKMNTSNCDWKKVPNIINKSIKIISLS